MVLYFLSHFTFSFDTSYRYTRGEDACIYVMFLNWPETGKIQFKCLKDSHNSATITFVGLETELKVSSYADLSLSYIDANTQKAQY